MEPSERQCQKCDDVRPLSMFYTGLESRRANREGRTSWEMHCRFCQRTLNDARRKPRQDYADRKKAEAGCADCGLSLPEHPEVFDFDHRDPAEKHAAVSALVTRGTFEDFAAEIEKCDVVCANCHRIRTRKAGAVSFGQVRR